MDTRPTDTEVLIAEDDEAIRECLQFCLELEGYQVRTAANGAQALEMMRTHLPQIILTDLRMPIMSGLELIEQRQQDPHLAQIPVIVMSAETELPDEEIYALAAVLKKPLDLARLLSTLRQATLH